MQNSRSYRKHIVCERIAGSGSFPADGTGLFCLKIYIPTKFLLLDCSECMQCRNGFPAGIDIPAFARGFNYGFAGTWSGKHPGPIETAH